VSTNAIARRYARALFHLASEQGTVEQYYTELKAFSDAMESSPSVGEIFAAPGYGIEAKRGIVKSLVGPLNLSRMTADFLLLLLDKKRMEALPWITAEYRSFADDAAGIVRTSVTSALPLSETQVQGMRQALEKATGKTVVMSVAEDPVLIGGVVTRIGDKIFDGSIRTQLAKIQDILQKG
jgi:F-type H+-transporting ATPase subunit delta